MSVVRPYTPQEEQDWRRRDAEGEPVTLTLPEWTCTSSSGPPNQRNTRCVRAGASIILTRFWDGPLMPGGPMAVASKRVVTVRSRTFEVMRTTLFEGRYQAVEVAFLKGPGWSARLVFEACPLDVVDAALAELRFASDPPVGSSAGAEVTLHSMDFTVPQRCAACLKPPDTRLDASRRARFGRLRRSIAIPYCRACAAHVQAARRRQTVIAWAMLVLAPACALVGFTLPALTLPVLVGLSTTLAIAVALAVRAALSIPGDAVQLVAFRGFDSSLSCDNGDWAAEVASLNDTRSSPRARVPTPRLRPAWVAAILAPGTALAVWLTSHRPVVIDHAGAAPVVVWLDGSPVATVPARPRWGRPPMIYASTGHHILGGSRVGASTPESTVEIDVERDRAHLYNPGATACYSVAGPTPKVQPIAEIYRFDPVGRWFAQDGEGDLEPATTPAGAPVNVERDSDCMEQLARGCTRDTMAAYVACRSTATTRAAIRQCRPSRCGPPPKPKE